MKTYKEQIEARCVHFNGLMNRQCDAGIVYDDLDKDCRITYRAGLPCIKPDVVALDRLREAGRTGPVECGRRQDISQEKLKEMLQEHEASIVRIKTLLPAVRSIKKEHHGEDWRGEITCPICNGVAQASHAACNGHVWIKCQTDGCGNIME